MYLTFIRICCILTIVFSLLSAQDIIYDEGLFNRNKSRDVRADVGKNIQAPARTTIVLDASGSAPSKGWLTYAWSFPPNMIFQDNYNFNKTDTAIPYELGNTGSGARVSLKQIITYNKYIELDLPDSPEGTKYTVVLKVEDHEGRNDKDTLMVTLTKPLEELKTETYALKVVDASPDIVASVEPILLEKEQPQITESKINENFISIQPVNRGELKPMEVEIISGIIYDEILELGLKDVMNPNRFIPDSIRINKLVELIRFKSDTLINKKKETTDTLITLDTLMFHELVDTVLYYNFDCKSDSCAAENALLEGVGQVLTWGINEYSELEVHFFNAFKHLNGEPSWVWTSSPVVLDPDASEKLHYPEALAVAENGTLLIAAANDQAVYELNINQQASILTRNLVLGETLLHPSGIDIGPRGLIYISDRDNHRLFSKLGKEYVSLLTPETNKDGSIKQDQPLFPTKIRVGPGGDIYVLYEGNDSVVKLDKDYRVSLVLQPSVINGIRDIAVNSKDSLFVVSPSTNRVYRVINDSTVVPYAGMKKTDNMVKNNIKATDSFLGLPVAIDFDSADQLYIGDKKFGLVRKVDSEGMITTLFGMNKKVEGISALRVSKGPNPKIFITQPLEHQIQRIALERVFHWRTETKINSPKYIIGKNGVYGLDPDIRATVSNVLREKLELPKEKKTFGALLQELNRRISAYIRKHPILFALLLILINQGISASLDGGGSLDLPPDFPSIP